MNTTTNILGYSNFNRHSNMDDETLSEISEIITLVHFGDEDGNNRGSFNLTNELYGLYDGYLYDDLLTLAKSELETTLYNRIENVVNIVSKYPKL